MILKVRNFIEVKVRLRDPLDDNAAQLIPSSRIITARHNVYQKTGAFGGAMNSLNRCQSSVRLDRGFV